MAELKPCPFCGSKNIGGYSNAVFVGVVKIGYTVGVCCDNCHAMIISTDKNKCVNDMIKVWNRRANDG